VQRHRDDPSREADAGFLRSERRARLRLAMLIWVLPYAVLFAARYGLGQAKLGEPLSWVSLLLGLQLFATIGMVRDLRRARALVLVAALLYLAYFCGVIPGFSAVSSVLPQLCVVALMAIALWLPFSSGQLSLAQAGFMALGAYGSAWLTSGSQWPFLPALLAGAFGTALVGFVVSYPALRLRGVYLAVATLGLGEVIRIFFVNFEPTGGAFGMSGIPKYTQTWHLVLALALTCVLLFALMRGRIGRAVWAVRNDEIAAAALGVETTRIRILTFTLGAFIAGLAGGLQAHYIRFIAPENYGLAALIDWLVIVMMGGYETFVGPLAATVVLGTLPELMRFLSDWRLLLNGAILVAFLVLRPNGIIGRELLGWRFSPAKVGRAGRVPAAARRAAAEAGASEVMLAVEGISKRFGGLLALTEVSFEVRRGQIHGLIGPNGAGKTTLFNAITGLYAIDAGRIVFDGEQIHNLRPQQLLRRGIARTFQNIRLFGQLSVLENVMLGGHARMKSGPLRCALGLDRREERAAAQRALHLLGLLDLEQAADDAAETLSYGDQRRLEIARALASDPELLLLDEPAAGMNAGEAAELGTLLRRICSELGKTILLIEHDMELVMSLCERVTVLDHGQLVTSDVPAEVQRHPAVIAAYLGDAGAQAGTKVPGPHGALLAA
jgi:ABC-type branched-subunit amino acid transport system ATPase component/ABC-type branched-subunit amino acid transport system permease subunit